MGGVVRPLRRGFYRGDTESAESGERISGAGRQLPLPCRANKYCLDAPGAALVPRWPGRCYLAALRLSLHSVLTITLDNRVRALPFPRTAAAGAALMAEGRGGGFLLAARGRWGERLRPGSERTVFLTGARVAG